MRMIGVCGRSGSGKSTLCSVGAEMGFAVFDCDKIYREIVSQNGECLSEIATHFGGEAVENGVLNRNYLANIVFSDPARLRELNSVTHKYVLQNLFAGVEALDGGKNVIFDAPALFESGLDEYCDTVIGVICDDDIAAGRICTRDGISRAAALARLNAQIPARDIISGSDILLYNNGTEIEFAHSAREILEAIVSGEL